MVTETISKTVKEDNLKLLVFNICGDHIQLLLVCDINDVSKIMQKIKAITSKILNSVRKTARKHAPSNKLKKPIWQQKYSAPKIITLKNQLENTIQYIRKNRSKHQLEPHKEILQNIIDYMCWDFSNL